MRKGAIAAGLAAFLMGGTALAGTIEVTDGNSIQAAINRASEGDTILVQPGTYAAFEVTKNNVTVKSAQQGGAHVIARGDNQPAIGSYGQSGVSILGFRLTSHGGDGMKIGGSPGNMVQNLRVEGNVVERAKLDGLKAFQARGLSMNNNTILLAGAGGPAGSSGNPNGDGGLDWVQVENSEMVGNSISTFGWACMMIKNGSHGNLIADNKLEQCEVNGLDMAAGSSGRAADANKSGKVAFNNVIEGNTLAGGKGCAAKFDETSTNNKLAGDNRISGRVCDHNGSNNANANPKAAAVGSTSEEGGYFMGGSTRTPSQFDRNVDGLTQNLYDTDEQFWSAVESGEASALQRLNDLVSGGLIVREGNNIINRATGQVVSTVGRTIGDAVDTVMQPVEDYVSGAVETLKCNFGGALIGGAATVINGIFTGGRSTFAGQVTSHMLEAAGNLCAGKQLAVQQRQLAEMKKMTASLNQNVVGGAGTISGKVGSSVRLYDADQVGENYQTGASARMTPDESAAYQRQLRAQTDQARRNALETAAMHAQAEQAYARMADDALELTQSAEGQTAALQGLAQLERAKEGAAASRAATQVALEHAKLITQEEERASERLAQERRNRLYRGLAPTTTEVAERPPFQMFQ